MNKEQLVAIKHQGGPLLIIAGAGTGKTTVITERIKHIIFSKLAKPEEILALTFTEKAAREMEGRVDEALPYGYTQMWISTFHSFCDRVLRDESLHIGLNPRYKLMTEAETVQLVRNNLFKFDLNYFRPLGNPNKFIEGLLQHFSRLQDEDVSPSDYIAWVNLKHKTNKKKQTEEEKLELSQYKELAKAYKTYEEIKNKEGFFDFGDLIAKALQLFRQRKNVLRQYQQQFKFVLVDEYQDTNIAQNELVKLLVGKDGNITVVLDDDQSIYRFRGAAVSNAMQFRNNFPKVKLVSLIKNYRSTQEILDKAYDLIQHNNPDRLEIVEKINKKLVAASSQKGESISFIHSDRVENEAEEVVKEITKLISSEDTKYQYRDIAILIRANNHADPFARALSRHGIPYQLLGPSRLFKQSEVIDLIAYLKVLYNFEDSVSFYRLLSIDHFGISAREIAALGNYARRLNISLFEAAEKVDVSEPVQQIIKLINKYLKLIRRETAGQLLYYFLQDTGLMQHLLSPDTPEAEKRALNVSRFFDKLKSYEVDHENSTVSAVVDWINLASELGESPLISDSDWTAYNAVNILTVHSAKGLEFPVVFLVNLVGQRFPTIERREQIPIPEALIKEILPVGDHHLEEERRLFYVGMTRAKEKLYLTAADYYSEGKREKKLSPFIYESLGKEMAGSEQRMADNKQLSFLDYQPPKFLYSIPHASPRINYLSYSQIETFKICPLHYKLKYLYKIPTAPSAALSFGTSMHLALKDFYLALQSERHTTRKDLRDLHKLLISLLKKNWQREGYLSKIHEAKMRLKGEKFLTDYFKTKYDSKIIPVMLEQPFTVPLGNLKIGGKIDRVDVLSDGRIEIIDYKTGANVPTQKDIDKDLQMSFYALAATNIPHLPFNKKPEEILLTFYYFDNQKTISTTRTRENLEKAKEEIFKYKDEIEKSDFKCSGSILCKNCEYKLLCNSD